MYTISSAILLSFCYFAAVKLQRMNQQTGLLVVNVMISANLVISVPNLLIKCYLRCVR